MGKAHRARGSKAPEGVSVQSTTNAAVRVVAAPDLSSLSEFEQQRLARESNINKSTISRMLSRKRGQRRHDPKFSTLVKLQTGLERLTGNRYSLESIGQFIVAGS